MPAAVVVPTLAALLRRVGSLEIAVANLQLRQGAAYRRGYDAGQRNRRVRLARRIEGLRGEHSAHLRGCAMGKEDKAALCHWAGRPNARLHPEPPGTGGDRVRGEVGGKVDR
jgi:hypothetical protein